MTSRTALIIGNSVYDDPTLARLNAPAADVRALAALLSDGEIGQFDSVRTLIDETEATTRRAIAAFYAAAKPDDLLLLYFSGHGVLDDQGRLYLAARDTQHDLPQGSALPAAFITDGMDSSRSRRQVLILDCCHSGAFARGARSAAGAKAVTAATFEGIGYGRAVLTATDSTQYAWEGDAVLGTAEHSVFTQHLIDGLSSGAADGDGDGVITLEELYDYVYSRVVSQTPRQTPRKWSYNQEGALVIARNPRPTAPLAAPLPAELQLSLDDPRSWVRKGAVQELARLLTQSPAGLAAAARAALEKLAQADDSYSVRAIAQAALGAPSPAVIPPADMAHEPTPPQQAKATAPVTLEASAPGASGVLRGSPAPQARWLGPAVSSKAVLAFAVGWALAFFAGTSVFWWVYSSGQEIANSRAPELGVFGLIGGVATLVGLRLAAPGSRTLPGLWVVLIAVVVSILGRWVSPTLQESGIDVHTSLAMERTLLGSLGGALMATALAYRGLTNRDGALRLAGGWALAWALGSFLVLGIYRLFGESPIDGLAEVLTHTIGWDIGSVLLPWVDALLTSLVGLIAGGLGGWVVVRELTTPTHDARRAR